MDVNYFPTRNGALYAEGVSLARIAREVQTPVYVYSAQTLRKRLAAFESAFQERQHLICYAVKANSNLAVVRIVAEAGHGFDIVSGGELARVRRAGGSARQVVFSGIGKSEEEIAAAIRARILMFNVESAEELKVLDAIARKLKVQAPFALRVNPEIDAKTHPYISTGLATSKFGVPFVEAAGLYRASRTMKGLLPRGLACHIGSQLVDMRPLSEAVVKVAGLYRELVSEGIPLTHLDVGGGLGVRYREEAPPSVEEYAKAILEPTRDVPAVLVIEPGRSLVANAGVLVTKVLYRKDAPAKRFVVVDAGMNDLLRPALYGAKHRVEPVRDTSGPEAEVSVVGPVCESSDVLATCELPDALRRGDLIAFHGVGAYGMSMSSNYNSRPRVAEVLVEGRSFRVVRRREGLRDLMRGESV